jgi:hypothetical protein
MDILVVKLSEAYTRAFSLCKALFLITFRGLCPISDLPLLLVPTLLTLSTTVRLLHARYKLGRQ